MKRSNRFIRLVVIALAMHGVVQGQTAKEFTHPKILSFETLPASVHAAENSRLKLSTEHYKHLAHSLKWEWTAPHAQWSINDSVFFRSHRTGSDTYLHTFVFWIYAVEPLKGQTLRVEFLKAKEVQCHFEYSLNFRGWRGAWLAFGRDMQGVPVEGMDEVRFTAPGTPNGTLYLDHIILSSLQDSRHHTADFQAPYINPQTTSHWLVLQKSWEKQFDLPLPNEVSPALLSDLNEIKARLNHKLLDGKKAKPIDALRTRFDEYNITANPDGTIKGLPIFFERYGETYELLGAQRYNTLFNNPRGLQKANALLLDLAISYRLTPLPADKAACADMFVSLIRHLMDQGFQAGSAMGTLHHAGYSMRNFYPAMLLMENPLRNNGLLNATQQAMEWFAGTGEVKTHPTKKGIDVDAFNTYVVARLASLLMMENTPEKLRYMHAFARWINNGYEYVEGTEGTFKIDGTMFHHRHHYPAYAVGGLTGAVEAVYLLRNTAFKITPQGHENLKKALAAMRIYCNLRTWPLSLSGRHPDGLGALQPEHFGLFALAGSPDGRKPIDPDMAGAYLRLAETPAGKYVSQLTNEGFVPEKSPEGNWTYNYACLNIHRRKEWMVAAMGHSRYLWATETYRGENMYGRYLNHGAIQILASGNPISNHGSGYNQEGWDWNHFPGTTATCLPIKDLRAKIRHLDTFSGFEEMLLSDEAFAGGISIRKKNGAHAIKLHEHDKYNGSLRARKSVFFFDNRAIALGTNIQSLLPQEVHTTLFQVYLPKPETPSYINGKNIIAFPYKASLTGQNILADGLNNYFFVKQGHVEFSKTTQHSLHEETDTPTQNNFAKAVINHGSAPRDGRYEYLILIQPDPKTLNNALKTKNHHYTVVQQDSAAHIVVDANTNTTGYVLFEPGKITDQSLLVAEANLPCLIMTETERETKINMSVCDPDLRFYQGPADEQFDANGKRKERSVYAREWINNPSAQSTVQLTLRGRWFIAEPNEHVQLKAHTPSGETTIEIKCRHGISREFQLLRADK